MRIVQISDTHITHLGGLTTRHLERAIEFVNESIRPDLIIHTGDLVALDADEAADRRAVRRLLAALEAPVRCVPGNHDVGDSIAPFLEQRVTSARIQAFQEAWGPDRWLQILDDKWGIIGLNSQLFGSQLAEEAEQWTWLDGVVAAVGDRSLLIFLHKPLWQPVLRPGTEGDPASMSVPDADRTRVLERFAPGQIEVVANGHLHHTRTKRRGGALEIWGPSTTLCIPRKHDWPVAPAQLGAVEYALSADGLEHCRWQIPGLPEMEVEDFWEIPGMGQARDRMKARIENTGSTAGSGE